MRARRVREKKADGPRALSEQSPRGGGRHAAWLILDYRIGTPCWDLPRFKARWRVVYL